ncbi:DUF5707 domain-containing protein [Streptomyces flavofungini]|uniref:DUF5707 domain-containing protein n=1 Tax=Streptomyces flavofungini TaxID=68200 RepID=UPI0034DF1A3E
MSSLVGAVVVGAVAVGGLASAAPKDGTGPSLSHASARYTAPSAPSGHGTGSLTFTADVHDGSGVRGLTVLPWPASSKLDPTEAELRHVESARCRSTAAGTSRCTYTLKVTGEDADRLARGRWYVAVRAVAEDGGAAFEPRAASFDVGR